MKGEIKKKNGAKEESNKISIDGKKRNWSLYNDYLNDVFIIFNLTWRRLGNNSRAELWGAMEGTAIEQNTW